jgi:hypothetical protein
MKTVALAALVVVLIAGVGVGAFFAGNAYGQQQANNVRADFFRNRQGGAGAPGQFSQTGPNGQGGQNAQFARPAATGTIKSVNGNLVQISEPDGSTVTVTLDSQTIIQKTVTGTPSDLQPGERITVLSDQTAASGANITARMIQLRGNAQP